MKNRSFFYRHFNSWLKDNRHRFTASPYIAEVHRTSFKVYFQESGSSLYLLVGKLGEFSIWTRCRDKETLKKLSVDTDWVADFDYNLRKTPDGFYRCDFCLKPTHYATREQLLCDHSYEEFLDWSNKNIIDGHEVCFSDGVTFIGLVEEIIKKSHDAILYRHSIKIKPTLPQKSTMIKGERP
jgi:hypothetical protein